MINLPPPPNYKPNKKSKGVFRISTIDDRKIIAAFIEKNGMYAAEAEFGVSTTLTRRVRKEFNIPKLPVGRKKDYADKDVISWIEYMKINPRITHAAVNFGVAENTIKRRINEYKSRNGLL
jgi:hypothetical protein